MVIELLIRFEGNALSSPMGITYSFFPSTDRITKAKFEPLLLLKSPEIYAESGSTGTDGERVGVRPAHPESNSRRRKIGARRFFMMSDMKVFA